MSDSEMVDAKEAENDVEGKSDVNPNDHLVEGQGKDSPLSHPPDQEPENPTESVEVRSDKDDIMEDAAKSNDGTLNADGSSTGAEKDEKCPCPSEECNVNESVVETNDAKSSVISADNQASVEVAASIGDVSVGNVAADSDKQMHDSCEDVKLKSDDNDDKIVGETKINADGNELSNAKEEGNDVPPLNEKSSGTKIEDVEKGDELNEKSEPNSDSGDKKNDLDANPSQAKAEDDENVQDLKDGVTKVDSSQQSEVKKEVNQPKLVAITEMALDTPSKSFIWDSSSADGYESGTEEEQTAFLKEVETYYKENNFEFKAPKFYKEELNLLKLWRAVIKLGGYEQVTSCKLWRQVGESFKPPKTCTTVSWTFRIFYEKALLEYEKHRMRNGELPFTDGSLPESIRDETQTGGGQTFGSGRARRDAAARAMQGWHSQRLLGNGQVSQPIIKDKNEKNLTSTPKSDKQQKTNGLLKRKKPSTVERTVSIAHGKTMKQLGDSMVMDIGPPADWVKINVQRTNDCFEIYALVPGLLREEVHVQSDPAGRLIISGQPEQLDNPWGVTPFKKVVTLPSRIDPHQTSAVVTLHGQLFVRVPFEQSDA